MVAEQLVLASKMMEEIAILINKDPKIFTITKDNEIRILNENFFDEDRYARAVNDDGLVIGIKKERCGQIWLNSNSWAVISGVSDEKRGNACMNSVMKYLNTDIGLVKQYPALQIDYPSKENPISWATAGIGENGGIFCHANTWAIIAYCILHRGDDAYKIYKELLPDHIIDLVGVNRYIVEPYIYSSNVRALHALRGGEGAVSWVTGTATWMNIAIQQYMFGIKPKFDGIEINPCLPSHIKNANVSRIYKNTTYKIQIINENKGICELFIDGIKQDSLFVKATKPIINVLIKC